MNCPRCEHESLKVLESRTAESGEAIRRRRECLECGYRFTTKERLERQPLVVLKSGGREQAFDREKLMYGLLRACAKRNIPAERLEALVIEIEQEIRAQNRSKVTSQEIGHLALQGLLRVDEVASLRFASVYREFQSIEEFSREMQRIASARNRGRAQAGQKDEPPPAAGRIDRVPSGIAPAALDAAAS